MMKRMMFLAAGVIASVALATPSYAGSIKATFTVTGGTADDIELFYTANVVSASIVSSTGIGSPTLSGIGTSNLVIDFGTASAAGNAILTVDDGTGHLSSFTLTGLTDGVSNSSLVVSAAVPEPSTMALLGIGMTSFLAFRRFFKRNAIA